MDTFFHKVLTTSTLYICALQSLCLRRARRGRLAFRASRDGRVPRRTEQLRDRPLPRPKQRDRGGVRAGPDRDL
jgi:hypothetical protein